MSRKVETDYGFDGREFTMVLSKAKGDRQQNEFAKEIGMNKSYLNCYLSGKMDHPLTPSTLLKISLVSANGVTIEELLLASGYNPENFIWNEKLIRRLSEEEKLTRSYDGRMVRYYDSVTDIYDRKSMLVEQNINRITGTITNALAMHGYKWRGEDKNSTPNTSELDFLVSIYEQPIQRWAFIYMVEKPFAVMHYQEPASIEECSHIVFRAMENAGDKISFVTTDEQKFRKLSDKSFPILNLFVSIILVDPAQMTVLDEKVIRTSCDDSDTIPKLI